MHLLDPKSAGDDASAVSTILGEEDMDDSPSPIKSLEHKYKNSPQINIEDGSTKKMKDIIESPAHKSPSQAKASPRP